MKLRHISNYKTSICYLLIFLWILSMAFIIFAYKNLHEEKVETKMKYFPIVNLYEVEKSYLQSIKRQMIRINVQKYIYNMDRFGDDFEYVIVVIVKNHTKNLEILIDSLRRVKNIDKALIIFSHCYFDSAINHLIREIQFTKFMQLFYTYSLQLRSRFRKQGKIGDCPVNMIENPETGICESALYSQTTDEPCQSTYTEEKNHWIWTVNIVFNKLSQTASYNGTILFLMENDYVAPDILTVWKKVDKFICKQSLLGIIVLGLQNMATFLPEKSNYNSRTLTALFNKYKNVRQKGILHAVDWKWKYQTGIAFNRNISRKIVNCAFHYCFYNCASWAGSLENLFGVCKVRVRALMLLAPRVYSIGECINRTANETFCESTVHFLSKLFIENDEKLKYTVKRVTSLSFRDPPKLSNDQLESCDISLCYGLGTSNYTTIKYDAISNPWKN